MENVRVLPLLVFTGLCLLVLKGLGLVLSGGYILSGAAPASAQNPPAAVQSGLAGSTADSTAKSPAGPVTAEADLDARPDAAVKAQKSGTDKGAPQARKGEKPSRGNEAAAKTNVLAVGPASVTTKSELAVLEGLANRRKALDRRAREIDLRENLLKAAEKRVEARIEELKAIETRIESELKKRDDHRKAQYRKLVKMYSGMKPKDAARIFERLDMNVLTGLVSQMKPRSMSAILAAMVPAAAERLTLEIARLGKPRPRVEASLPKIQAE